MDKNNGVIAAGHHETARAGAEILAAGGNAFDAALGAMLTSFVAEPSLTSLGGGGFLTAYTASGQAWLFDFFVQTPLRKQELKDLDWEESAIRFGNADQLQYSGRGAVAVPGCPAGLFEVHEKLGRIPLAEVAAPAIQLARAGVVYTPYQVYGMEILEPILLAHQESREIYGPGDRLWQTGEKGPRPRFTDALEALVKGGREAFYEGELTEAWLRAHREEGGSLSRADLKAYQVHTKQPLRVPYRGYELLTNTRPSAGGSMISFGLSWLAQQDLAKIGHQGPAYVECLAAAMHQMDRFRRDHLQEATSPPIAELLHQKNLMAYQQPINWLGNTSHISVMDREGNAASLTSTLGGASGRAILGTGIPTNNMLGEVDLFPGGLHSWRENTRVTSMMSPSILLHDQHPWLVLGTGGSSRIRSAILQVILHMVDHGMSLEEAVSHPRLHWEDFVLNLEPGLGLSDDYVLGKNELVRWPSKNMFFGGVHAVLREADGMLSGMADARRDGAVA
ncbi:MAG: gamma-glutamyltransferase [Bacteroidota bacterium]